MKPKILAFLVACIVLLLSQPNVAQQASKVLRVGLFHVGLDHVPPSVPALREALKELGYVEGKNIHLDWRNLPDEDAAVATAKEFARTPVDLIIAFEDQTIRAAKAATKEVPVLFLHANAPVVDGFVKSFAHPGGNMTGFVAWPVSNGKQVELFKELVPGLRSLLLLVHPGDPVGRRWLDEMRLAGEALKLRLIEREATNQAELERVIRSINRDEVGGALVASQILRNSYSALIIRLISEKRLPLGMHRKAWVERGALFSYSADLASVGRAAAPYVDKLLKGTKPADLPVDQVSRFELVINLKSANQLGLTIPQSVLYRANEVIR
ncbi:MAG: ABC transporter substrate-binding protein [Deltaproteobacteria bacterium]|nr:ABC transporter substrate-binding protein [Deltaproteobacteria bacterium]